MKYSNILPFYKRINICECMNHYIATSYFTCAHISSLFPLQNSALDQLVPCSVGMVTSGTKADCLKTKIYYTTLIRTTALPNE